MPTNFLPLPFFAGFTAFTPEVPKLYWDVKSQEQRYFMLCKEMHKLICYADSIADRLNNITAELEETMEQFKADITAQLAEQDAKITAQLAAQDAAVSKALAEMRSYIDYRFDTIAEGMNIYDVTTGEYRPSDEALRRLYSALAFDHTGERAIVSEVAENLTVEQLANVTVYKAAWSNRDTIVINGQLPTIEGN